MPATRSLAAPTAPSSPSPERPGDPDAGARKLIRPALPERSGRSLAAPVRRREAPPEATGAEEALLARWAAAGTEIELVLETGDVVRGELEWVDRDCLKLRRAGDGPLVVMRRAITTASAVPTHG